MELLCYVLFFPCQRGVCVYGWNHTPAAVPVGGHAWHWVGMLCLGWFCQSPTERCSTLPGGWGRVGAAFSPSVTQEMAISNLCHLGSPSLNCHLLSFTQCRLCPSCSPKGAHFWCPPLSPGRVHPAVHAWPDAAGGGFDYTGKKLSHIGSRQLKLQQEGFQLDVKKDAPFGKEKNH